MLVLFLSEGIVVKLLCFMLNDDVGMLAAMLRCKVLLDWDCLVWDGSMET